MIWLTYEGYPPIKDLAIEMFIIRPLTIQDRVRIVSGIVTIYKITPLVTIKLIDIYHQTEGDIRS